MNSSLSAQGEVLTPLPFFHAVSSAGQVSAPISPSPGIEKQLTLLYNQINKSRFAEVNGEKSKSCIID